MLSPAGDHITILALNGACTGRAGAGLDRTTADRSAAATIRSLVARLACALVHPAGAAGPSGRDPPRPPGEDKP
jgi:hypothetical protein